MYILNKYKNFRLMVCKNSLDFTKTSIAGKDTQFIKQSFFLEIEKLFNKNFNSYFFMALNYMEVVCRQNTFFPFGKILRDKSTFYC